jgi:hypothetical protein
MVQDESPVSQARQLAVSWLGIKYFEDSLNCQHLVEPLTSPVMKLDLRARVLESV